MAGKGLVGNSVDMMIQQQKALTLKNVFKKEITIPVADLSVEKAIELLKDKYTVVEDKRWIKDKTLRVTYDTDRSLVIKMKANKKNPSETILKINNEFGEATYEEQLNDINAQNTELLTDLGKGAASTGKVLGKAAIGLGKGAVGIGKGFANNDTEGMGKAAGGLLKNVGSAAGEGIAKAGKATGKMLKQQIKDAKEAVKQAKETKKNEDLYTAYLRLMQISGSGIANILSRVYRGKWRKEEAEKLPAIVDAVVAELKK